VLSVEVNDYHVLVQTLKLQGSECENETFIDEEALHFAHFFPY
jgi:hypothetical protein